jgi:integrase
MTLQDLLARYLREHPYGVSQGHADMLRWSIAAWERFAGRSLTAADLNAQTLNPYLDWMRTHRRPDTIRSRRGNLLTLWRFAFEAGIVDEGPRQVRKLRRVQRTPEAWSVAEVSALIRVADGLPGAFWHSRIRCAAWWGSLIRSAYDTGLRLGDLLAIGRCDVHPVMQILQHKTGRAVVVQLRPSTIALIDQTLADQARDLVWPLWCRRQTFYEHFRHLVNLAGIRRGTFKWLRRSAATQLERVDPGRGTQLLGHSSRATTETWYIDRAQLGPAPLPPMET